MTDQFGKIIEELEGLPPGNDRLPPVDQWDPPLSGDIDILIDATGQWFHEGGEIKREALVKLFSTVLKREGDEYFLVTPVEKWRIRVEDVPFVVSRVERLESDGEQVLVFYTSVGDRVIAGPDNPLRVAVDDSGEPRPYLLIRGGMEGLLARPVFYQLADFAEKAPDKKEAVHGVYSLGRFFPLE